MQLGERGSSASRLPPFAATAKTVVPCTVTFAASTLNPQGETVEPSLNPRTEMVEPCVVAFAALRSIVTHIGLLFGGLDVCSGCWMSGLVRRCGYLCHEEAFWIFRTPKL
jgi:hypothetical protein